jgi:D-alanyl-D-alanine carboxypeptidase/D-alanyl-D-alanine-endopeptidase (penicillin-binding protein 4)
MATVMVSGTIATRPAPAIAQVQFEDSAQIESTESARGFCPTDIESAITSVVSQPHFASAQWGVLVESAATQEVLYSYNADRYFIPASNIKLLTTATALQDYGQYGNRSSGFVNQIQIINRDSHNATADSLFRALGGQRRVQDTLSAFGIDPYSFRQVDGSGLSRYNMVQPTTMVEVLRMMRLADGQDLFYDSLPVAGVSGTLRRRFIGTPAQGRVRAKTGTLRGVRALSGYMDTPSGESVIFSILVNQPGQSGAVMIDAIDQIVLELTRLQPCL